MRIYDFAQDSHQHVVEFSVPSSDYHHLFDYLETEFQTLVGHTNHFSSFQHGRRLHYPADQVDLQCLLETTQYVIREFNLSEIVTYSVQEVRQFSLTLANAAEAEAARESLLGLYFELRPYGFSGPWRSTEESVVRFGLNCPLDATLEQHVRAVVEAI